MELNDLLTVLRTVGVAGIIVIIGSIIKITPLQINIWSWIARKLGNAFNHDMIDQLSAMQKKQSEIELKLDAHIAENEEDAILRARKAILDFAREIVNGEKHTREQYQECLLYIDIYEAYCREHPNFPNNRAVLAIQMVKDNYQERLEKADFLAENYRKSKKNNEGK